MRAHPLVLSLNMCYPNVEGDVFHIIPCFFFKDAVDISNFKKYISSHMVILCEDFYSEVQDVNVFDLFWAKP